MDKFSQLRHDNPVFIYKSYSFSQTDTEINASFVFEIPGVAVFTPGWSFPKPQCNCPVIDNNLTLERLVFSLGMAELVSYWKAVCSPEIIVECGCLDSAQIDWWKKLYFLGLGEFFYVNGISAHMDSFVNITCNGAFSCTDEVAVNNHGCLVPVGGGKDSALTLETLVSNGVDCRCYAINKRCSISATVETAGLDEDALIVASRRFDRSLVELNNKGYLNGHTPFSAIVAFSAEITAYLHGLQYVVLSNEASANESSVVGQSVNHQYSKSFEFENDFHSYEINYLKSGVYYFSFLRPLSEFQIASMFVSHKKYLPVFRSCNLGSKVSPDIWCGDCPKCLFVCLILSPFVDLETLSSVFGKNLLDDESMLDDFIGLLGLSEHKPFECVGSIDEVKLSVSLAVRNLTADNRPLPLLFRYFVDKGLYNPDSLDGIYDSYRKYYNNDNLLPSKFEAILKNEMERLL